MHKTLYLATFKTDKTFSINEIHVIDKQPKGYVVKLNEHEQFLPYTKLFTEIEFKRGEIFYFCVSNLQAKKFIQNKLFKPPLSYYGKVIPSQSGLEDGKVWLEMQKQRRKDHRKFKY